MKRLTLEKEKALAMRRKGMSYSQIKESLKVSKSTLSAWLSPYPLSAERIRELRTDNQQRIERCRNTKLQKRNARLASVYETVKNEIGTLSKREIHIAGLFLYWGEGDKSGKVFSISNTDPGVMRFFVSWARSIGVPEDKLVVILHLYADMDEAAAKSYWSNELRIPLKNFKKPYRKTSTLTGLTYKNGFGHGTCMVRVYDKRLATLVIMSIKYLSSIA